MKALLVFGHCLPTQQALWEEVAKRDIDVHVAYTLDIPRHGAGAPSYGVPHQLRGVRVRGDRPVWMAYRGLGALVRFLEPDVVHVLNEPWALMVGQALGHSSARVVTHGCETLWDQGGRIEATARRLATRRNLRRTSGFVSWNRDGVRWAERRGLPEGSPTLVLSAELPRLERFADPGRRRPAARARWGLEDQFVVAYVGRLVPEKGLAWLLEAWAASALPSDARLVFVGDGPLEGLIRSAGASDPRIRLLGPVSLGDIPEVMAAIDALVLPSLTTPSWSEQYGRVITEAMASGVPVVASDSGAIPEVVGEAGVLVREGSTTELAIALVQVGSDPAERARLRQAGYTRAEDEFSPRHGAERLISFWDQVRVAPRR